MPIDDNDYEELLALLGSENLPDNPVVARIEVEKFVDLVELLSRPIPPSKN